MSVRLDPDVLEWLRGKGEGHLTPGSAIFYGEFDGSGTAGGESIDSLDLTAL